MDERRAVLVDLLKVDHELRGVVFREREHLGAVESDNMVRDHVNGRAREVRVVDPKRGIEPVDFVRDEDRRDEALSRDVCTSKPTSQVDAGWDAEDAPWRQR
jgi:hypothetical protein